MIPDRVPDQVKEHHEERVRSEREADNRENERRADRRGNEIAVWVERRADAEPRV